MSRPASRSASRGQLQAASAAEREEAAAVLEMLVQISLGPPVNPEALQYITATAAFFEVRPTLLLVYQEASVILRLQCRLENEQIHSWYCRLIEENRSQVERR